MDPAPAERFRPLCRSGELVVSVDRVGPLAYSAAWHWDFWTIFVVRAKSSGQSIRSRDMPARCAPAQIHLERRYKIRAVHGFAVGDVTEIFPMKTLKFALLAAGLLAVAPAFAQTAGGTANTGPQGTGNFVAGKPEGSGNFVAGKPEGNGNFVAGKPEGNGNFVAGKPKDPAK